VMNTVGENKPQKWCFRGSNDLGATGRSPLQVSQTSDVLKTSDVFSRTSSDEAYSTTTVTVSLPPLQRMRMKYIPAGMPLHSHSNSPLVVLRASTRICSFPSTFRPIVSYTPSIASRRSKLPSQATRAFTRTFAGWGYGSDAQKCVV